jgi:hypothetical protein
MKFNLIGIKIAKGGFKLAAFGVKQGGIGSLFAGGLPGLKKTGGVKPQHEEQKPKVTVPEPVVPSESRPIVPEATAIEEEPATAPALAPAPAIESPSTLEQSKPAAQKPKSRTYLTHLDQVKLD